MENVIEFTWELSVFNDTKGNENEKRVFNSSPDKFELLDCGRIKKQRYIDYLFEIIILDFDQKKELTGKLKIYKNTYLMLFNLHTEVEILTANHKLLRKNQKNACFLAYYDTGVELNFKIRSGKSQFICIVPRTDWFIQKINNHNIIKNLLQESNKNILGCNHLPSIHLKDKIKNMVSKFLADSDVKKLSTEAYVINWFTKILTYYEENLITGNFCQSTKVIDDILEICQFIEKNHCKADFGNIKALANLFFYTERSLTRSFKVVTGCTIQQYIEKLRIESAIKYLNNQSQLSIHDISKSIGFKDQGYFCKVFAKRTGLTPSQYINQNIFARKLA